MKVGTYKIPFHKDSMMEYTTYKEGDTCTTLTYGYPTEWRDNTPFEATIQLTGQYRGRSAARVRAFNTKTKETYSLALGAFYEAVVALGVTTGGTITGVWVFRKQGANYGLYPWESPSP